MENTKITNLASKFLILMGVIVLSACSQPKTKEAEKTVTLTVENKVEETPFEKEVVAASAEKIARGKEIYMKSCFACHQATGEGIPNAFPPLAKSDYLNEDVNRSIEIVLNGKTGEITVNGSKYNSAMTAQPLSNEEVADVLTFVYNSWGNNNTNVTTEMVEAIKNK
jgi:nitrite reductase (NO-forming)